MLISNYIDPSNYADLNAQLSSSNQGGGPTVPGVGLAAFFNPNNPILGENLGLAAFSGYTKVVDISIILLGTTPRVLCLVYYEDTYILNKLNNFFYYIVLQLFQSHFIFLYT